MAKIVYLCSDLLFTSKIRELSTSLGHTPASARDAKTLAEAATGPEAAAAILDLRRPDALSALEALRAAAPDLPAIGFCDHERTDLMAQAQALGCRTVTKGQLAAELRRLLAPN